MNSVPSVSTSSDSGSTLRPWRRITTSAAGDSTSPTTSATDSRGLTSKIPSSVNRTPPVTASDRHASSVNDAVCENGSTCTTHGTAIR